MKRALSSVVLALFFVSLLAGCTGMGGPSTEDKVKEAEEARETAKQQAEFAKSLPPIDPNQHQ